MPRQKTPKLDKFRQLPNCFDSTKDFDLNRWKALLNGKELVVELGCGKAEVARGLAAQNPKRLFIGVDVKADRLQRAGTLALEAKLNNLVLLRAQVGNLAEYFDPNSLSDIWLTFSDPYPKAKHAKRRLTKNSFVSIYRSLLKPGGKLHIKTDNDQLIVDALESFKNSGEFEIEAFTEDLHSEKGYKSANIMTTFEKRFVDQGLPINYLQATYEPTRQHRQLPKPTQDR